MSLTEPFAVPEAYLAQLNAADLDERGGWLAGVPARAAYLADAWRLSRDGDPRYGFVGVVWPMRTPDGTPVMLKLSWQHDESVDEGLALATWAGNGTVALLAHDDDGLLLERLDPDRSLDDEPLDAAVEIAATLLRRLSVPAPPLHRSTRELAAKWAVELPRRAADRPIPRRIVGATVDWCDALADSPTRLLVNEDLHFQNVLRGEREPWLVIDPKPIAGEPEFGAVPLIWNRYEESVGAQGIRRRLGMIVDVAGLDGERARGWTLLRAVQNWLWVLDGGSRDIDALAEIADAMTR